MTTTSTKPTDAADGWHLDKKVPITLIFALLVQGATTLWFIAKLDARITMLELTRLDSRAQQRERDDRQDAANADAFAQVRQQLLNMDGKLDRLIERQAR